MNTINTASTKIVIKIEQSCLQKPYAALRVHKKGLLGSLIRSMGEHGQLVPVVVVPSAANQWVLMDGYLRVKALGSLGQDEMKAEVWSCDVSEALLALLTTHQARTWETLEEALLLRELQTQHRLSQNSIAARIGRDPSWVSRRLSLLAALSETSQEAIRCGKVSMWSASRILVPMARAIPLHAQRLLEYLLKNTLSTRELRGFYDHYQESNNQQRSKMVDSPDLFFKAQKLLAAEKVARVLQRGPEGKWHGQLRVVRDTLTELIALTDCLFTAQQDPKTSLELIEALNESKTQFDVLGSTVRRLTDAPVGNKTDDSRVT